MLAWLSPSFPFPTHHLTGRYIDQCNVAPGESGKHLDQLFFLDPLERRQDGAEREVVDQRGLLLNHVAEKSRQACRGRRRGC